MPGVSSWQAATAGFAPRAAHVSQFLGTHQFSWVYAGALQASQQTSGSGFTFSNSLWMAQSFTAGASQASAGYVMAQTGVTGSPAPWTVSLQADNGSGAPSGTALVSAPVPKEFLSGSVVWRTVLLPYSGLTPSARYWIVAAADGDPSDNFWWQKSNQTSGASTSANGTTWTAQAYGLMFQVFDGTPAGQLTGVYEDAGARWTVLTYTSGLVSGIAEWTAGQASNGYTWSSRTLSYSGDMLTGVA